MLYSATHFGAVDTILSSPSPVSCNDTEPMTRPLASEFMIHPFVHLDVSIEYFEQT
jgi:hypothetical protein